LRNHPTDAHAQPAQERFERRKYPALGNRTLTLEAAQTKPVGGH
jgi:hypothetical protein